MHNHTFVICAYKECRYLDECITSLINQSVPSRIICATSTPNDFIASVCQKYDIPLSVNPVSKGIGADWNFAYAQAETEFVTIVHQDDVYEPRYCELMLKQMGKSKRPLIGFPDYYEIRDGQKVTSNRLLLIKRLLCTPWRFRFLWGSRWAGRLSLTFGDPVMCPAVMFAQKNIIKTQMFNEDLKNNSDWLAWIEIRDLPGDFVYCPKQLLGHRIHTQSETTVGIASGARSAEDLQILEMMLPKKMAKIVHKHYVKGHDSNSV